MTGTWIGMHHYVADYVPENQIWISNKLPEEEREKVILHEFTERDLMSKGMPYNLAHIEALKTEGDITEAQIKEREYISPQEVRIQFSRIFPITEKENEWDLKNNKKIIFDPIAGIIYVHEGDKITDQLLVRSSSDIEKFVTKHKIDKVKEC